MKSLKIHQVMEGIQDMICSAYWLFNISERMNRLPRTGVTWLRCGIWWEYSYHAIGPGIWSSLYTMHGGLGRLRLQSYCVGPYTRHRVF